MNIFLSCFKLTVGLLPFSIYALKNYVAEDE